MLVEINLLPRKEPRKFGFLAALLIIAAIFLLIAALYFWQIHATNQQIQEINNQIALLDKGIETKTAQSKQNKPTNSADRLKKSIDWVEASRIKMVPILDELTSLLPDRGFILSYQSETNSQSVQLTVQFDTANDAAYYLNRLNKSNMVTEASISALNSNQVSTDSSTNSNSSATAPGTGINSQIQANTGNIATENNSAGINAAAGDVKNSPQADSSSLNNQGLPRYLAQFTIKLNQKEIKKIENKKAEGVAGS